MPIAKYQYEALGGRTYLPDTLGTAGQTPLQQFAFGSVVGGDCEAEFVYLRFAPVAAITLNQGDVVVWDSSYTAYPATLGAAYHPFGASGGTVYYGGRVGDPAATAAQGNVWSYAFAPGVYGMWVQRAGTSLINLASINAQTKAVSTTATPGQVDQPSAGAANSQVLTGVYSALLTGTFTGNLTINSPTITAVSSCKNLYIGQTLSGTGIPNGATVADIQGSTITMSANATATNTAVTVTWKTGTFYGTTSNAAGSTLTITSTQNYLPGVYPNQVLSGTGVGSSAVISAISGGPGAWVITVTVASTASGTVSIAASGANYYECMLRWPYISAQN